MRAIDRVWLTTRRALLIVALAACGDDSLAPLPLDIRIQASRATAAVGETVSFVVNAQGGTLVGVEMNYGDGDTDLHPTSGARTARITFDHAYSAAGTYQVRATVTDAVAGMKDATVEVQVQ
jgi:plastocyanin